MEHSGRAVQAVFALLIASSITAPVRAEDAVAPAASVPVPPQAAPAPAASSGASPVTIRLQYTGEAAENATGGLHNGGTYMNNIDAQLRINADKAFGWTGGKFLFEAFYNNANSLSARYVGAVQDPSAIDTEGAMFRLYQAYYEQSLGSTNVLFGIYDLETEFGATKPMDIFFNGAYAWTTTLDQSGLNGPSTYPNTSLALRVRQQISDHWSVQVAALDGVPDNVNDPSANAIRLNRTNGALLIGEVDYMPTRTTKIMAGYWNYTGQFEGLNQTNGDGSPRQVSGSRGGYVGGATRLYSHSARRGLDAFANVGIADSLTNVVDASVNAGLTYTGLFDARPRDRLGVAVGVARASSAFKDMQIAAGERVNSYETNFEITYRAPINSWLTVQPDIQYWIHPGLDGSRKNDLLFMLYFEIAHMFNL